MSRDEESCLVDKCRHKMTHHTFRHKCGTCSEFGHGQIECGNEYKIESLMHHTKSIYVMHLYPALKVFCTSPVCRERDTHTIEAHHPEFELSSSENLRKYLDGVGPRLTKRISNKPGYYASECIGHGLMDIYRNNNGNIEYKSFDIGSNIEIENYTKDYIKSQHSPFM